MSGHNSRPAAVVHKGLAIVNSIRGGATSIAAIAEATGFPSSTIVRVLSVLVHEDGVVAARLTRGALHLAVGIQAKPDDRR